MILQRQQRKASMICHKTAYADERTARLLMAKRASERKAAQLTRKAVYCPLCLGWHIEKK